MINTPVEHEDYQEAIRSLALYAKTYGFEDDESEIFRKYIENCEKNNLSPCDEVMGLNLCPDTPQSLVEKFEYEINRSIKLSTSTMIQDSMGIDEYREHLVKMLRDEQIFRFDGYLDWDVVEVGIIKFDCKPVSRGLIDKLCAKPGFQLESEIEISLSSQGELLTDDLTEAKESVCKNVAEINVNHAWVLVDEGVFIIDK